MSAAPRAGAPAPRPWYRQFWPWFLIVLPASSVVFSFALLYVALTNADEVLPHEGDSTSYSAPAGVPDTAGQGADRPGETPEVPGP